MTAPLPWHERKESIPGIPGSLGEVIPRLHTLLRLTAEANGRLDETVAWPTDDHITTLRKGLNRLGRCGLIRRIDRDTVELTASASTWIQDGERLQLIKILHENVRFIGELLFELSNSSNGLTHEEIRTVAVEDYRLPWKYIHPVRKWTMWLRAAGCVFLRFDSRVVITDVGRRLLNELKVATPGDVNGPDLSTVGTGGRLAGPAGLIKATMGELDDVKLRDRALGYGYIPRPTGSTIPATVRALMAIVGIEVERSQFIQRCSETFGLGESLAPRPLATLMTLGLIAQTGATTYAATALGREWFKSGTDVDLVRIFHAKLAMVGELLDSVDHYDKAPSLSRYAVEKYGFRHDVDGIRIRLHLLTAAGLLQEYGLGRFRITRLGAAFRDGLPRLRADGGNQVKVQSSGNSELDDDSCYESRASISFSAHASSSEGIANESMAIAWVSGPGVAECQEVSVEYAFRFDDLHPWVRSVSAGYWVNGHYRDAVEHAARSVNFQTQKLVWTYKDGTDLMNYVFSADSPKLGEGRKLRFRGDPRMDSWKNRMQAAQSLGRACFMGLRNLAAHEQTLSWHQELAFQYLVMFSVLAHWIEECDPVGV